MVLDDDHLEPVGEGVALDAPFQLGALRAERGGATMTQQRDDGQRRMRGGGRRGSDCSALMISFPDSWLRFPSPSTAPPIDRPRSSASQPRSHGPQLRAQRAARSVHDLQDRRSRRSVLRGRHRRCAGECHPNRRARGRGSVLRSRTRRQRPHRRQGLPRPRHPKRGARTPRFDDDGRAVGRERRGDVGAHPRGGRAAAGRDSSTTSAFRAPSAAPSGRTSTSSRPRPSASGRCSSPRCSSRPRSSREENERKTVDARVHAVRLRRHHLPPPAGHRARRHLPPRAADPAMHAPHHAGEPELARQHATPGSTGIRAPARSSRRSRASAPAGSSMQCGLKGYRIGDAQISHIHANIMVNLGRRHQRRRHRAREARPEDGEGKLRLRAGAGDQLRRGVLSRDRWTLTAHCCTKAFCRPAARSSTGTTAPAA